MAPREPFSSVSRHGSKSTADSFLLTDDLEHRKKTSKEPLQPEEFKPREMTLCRQLAVCAGFLSSDGGLVFMQLSMLPCLQTLGVPVASVTIPGCLSGTLAVLGLPVLGWVSDGGSHPHRRKRPAVVVATMVFLAGLMLVVSGCAVYLWKILPDTSAGFDGILQGEPFAPVESVSTTGHYERNNTNRTSPNRLNTPSIQDLDVNSTIASTARWLADPLGLGIPLPGLLGILGFALVDMGNDLSNSCLKSFGLASAAHGQHVSMLVLGVLMSAVGGCVAAVFGVVDIGAWLASGTVL